MSIFIDEEFQALIPPLSPEEYKQLEENCVKDGIRDPLVVWPQGDGNDILIDGHNRFEICTKHSGCLDFDIKRLNFQSREEAKEWIIKNQLGRRNIPAYVRAELALKLKPVIAERAKEKQASHTEQGYQKSDKAVHTTKELAKAAGVSHDTIHKVEVIQKKASPEAQEALRKGEASINSVYSGIVAAEHEDRRQREARELREAKQRSEKYDQKKTVDLEEYKQNNEDKKLIFKATKDDFRKFYSDALMFGSRLDRGSFQKAMQGGTPEDLKELLDKLEDIMQIVHNLKGSILKEFGYEE